MFKKFFFTIILITFSFLFIELSSAIIWKFYISLVPSSGVLMVKNAIGEDLSHMQQLVSNPYSLYWNNHKYKDEFGEQYDVNGYRSVEFDSLEEKLKILALGGSTTNMYPFIKNRKNIWTSIVSEKLDSIGIKNHVFNAGLPSGTSAELLTHYFLKAQNFDPDLIILHTGGNDVTSLFFPNYKSDYSHLRSSNNGYLNPRPGERLLLKSSYFFRNFYHVWLKGNGLYKPKPYSYANINRLNVLKMVKKNKSIAFEKNIKSIIKHAISEGSKVLIIPFVQAHPENLSRNRPDLKGLEEALMLGLEKHTEILKDIANENNLNFFQIDTTKISSDWFVDNCHLNEAGEREKAEQIFKSISQNLINYSTK